MLCLVLDVTEVVVVIPIIVPVVAEAFRTSAPLSVRPEHIHTSEQYQSFACRAIHTRLQSIHTEEGCIGIRAFLHPNATLLVVVRGWRWICTKQRAVLIAPCRVCTATSNVFNVWRIEDVLRYHTNVVG